MRPCLEGEGCDLLINRSGWTCTQPGGRIKTTTVRRGPGSLGGPWRGSGLGCAAHPGGAPPGPGTAAPMPAAQKARSLTCAGGAPGTSRVLRPVPLQVQVQEGHLPAWARPGRGPGTWPALGPASSPGGRAPWRQVASEEPGGWVPRSSRVRAPGPRCCGSLSICRGVSALMEPPAMATCFQSFSRGQLSP